MRVPVIVAVLMTSYATSASAQQTVHLAGQDIPLQLRAENVFRVDGVGKASGPGSDVPIKIAFDSAGNLYVLEATAKQVVVIDSMGKLVRTIGKAGTGPGDFDAPEHLGVAPDGGVTIVDIAQRQYLTFAPNGRFVNGYAMPGDVLFPHAFAYNANGFFAVPSVTTRFNAQGGGTHVIRSTTVTNVPIYHIDMGTSTASPIAHAYLPPLPPGDIIFQPNAFVPELQSAAGFTRIAFADSTTYTVHIMDGTTEWLVRRDIAPRAPTSADHDAAFKLAHDNLYNPDGTPNIHGTPVDDTMRSPARLAARALAAMTYQPVIPVIAGLRIDGTGRLWVARSGAPWGQPGPIDLIDHEMHYIGTIAGTNMPLPDAIGRNGRAAFIEHDAQGTPYIMVRRLNITP